MTTTTSYSNKNRFSGLYKSTLRRNAGYFGLYTALLFLFYPLQYLLEAFKKLDPMLPAAISELAAPGEAERLLAEIAANPFYNYEFLGIGMNFTSASVFFFTVLVLAAPLVLALLLNSYMHSKKCADVFHALPVTRGMLVGVNAAVAMTIISAPVVLFTLLIAVVQIAKFGFIAPLLGALVVDTIGWLVAAFTIYTVTVFVSTCVGTVFDNFVFSGVLLFAAPMLCGIGLMLAEFFLYGFSIEPEAVTNLLLLSPVLLMPMRFMFGGMMSHQNSTAYSLRTELAAHLTKSNVAIVVYLVLAALLLFATIRLYRKRRSEMAENTTSRGILQVMIKLIGTIVSTIMVGLMFYGIYDRDNVTFLIWAVIGGLMGYAIIEVILNRGFKTLAKSLPLGALMVALSIGGSAILMTGGLGYEKRVPAQDNITSIEVSYEGRYAGGSVYEVPAVNGSSVLLSNTNATRRGNRYRTKTLIEPVNIAAVVDFHQRAVEEQFERNDTALLDVGESRFYPGMEISYTLKNGRSVTRRYSMTGLETLKALAPLDTNPEIISQSHIAYLAQAKDTKDWTFSDVLGASWTRKTLPESARQQLLDAMKADFAAMNPAEIEKPSKAPVGYITLLATPPEEGAERFTDEGYFIIYEGQETYKAMDALGLLPLIQSDAECFAVAVEAALSTDGSYMRYMKGSWNSNGPIWQQRPDEYGFATSDLKDLEEMIAQDEESWEAQAKYATDARATSAGSLNLSKAFIAKDAQTIEQLRGAIVGSSIAGGDLAVANFYMEGAQNGTPVFIDMTKLSDDLRARIVSHDKKS